MSKKTIYTDAPGDIDEAITSGQRIIDFLPPLIDTSKSHQKTMTSSISMSKGSEITRTQNGARNSKFYAKFWTFIPKITPYLKI